MLTVKPLLSTGSLFVAETFCRVETRRPSEDELEPTYTVVFPRVGYFVRHVGPDRVIASPTVALFLNSGETQRTSHPNGLRDECVFVSMSEAFVEPFLDHRTDRFRTRTSATSAEHDLALRRLVREAKLGTATPLDIEETLSTILTELVVGAAPPRRHTPQQKSLVADAEEYLAMHYAEDADLPTVARAVGSSPHHLSRLFRSATGITLSAYRVQLRVRSALRRIVGGAEDLAAVAVAAGFYDHAHMTNTIRRQAGTTPSAIRRSFASG